MRRAKEVRGRCGIAAGVGLSFDDFLLFVDDQEM